ncbi:MAG: D-glucuronyl C5-epimerase family protein [Solirubrobacteraceae bacterium]
MGNRLIHLLATLALAVSWAVEARADEIPVLGAGKRADPGVRAIDRTPVPPHSRVRPTALSAQGPSTLDVLKRLYRQGEIDQIAYQGYREEYQDDKAFAAKLEGAREIAMRGALTNVDQIAARGQLTASRLEPLWLILQRNREWWSTGPLLVPGQRVSFPKTELVFEYVSGEGLQIHPLANFGKLNALWRSRVDRDRMRELMDELLAVAAWRSGSRAWEYYYDFGGGAPPWVSSLSQGTGLQSLARAATKAGVAADVLPELAKGVKVFQRRTPAGVRVPVAGPGDHYAQYSFAPDLRILNGFIQSLVGLYDFATLAADDTARALFEAGDDRAAVEIPTYDTGAWSLYSRGTSRRESNLNYHVVLRDFLTSLCDRTQERVPCGAEANFTRYLEESPVVRVRTRRLSPGEPGSVRFSLSKIASVAVALERGGRTVYSSSTTRAYGRHALAVTPPKTARAYDVTTTATDLAGNSATTTARIAIRPRK